MNNLATFQGWLPGQEIVDHMPVDPTCLGLQWKVSPTPMLPTSLYWTAQKCAKYGGYICKSKKQKIRETYVQNKTIAAAEGRLTSPGYPNTYPLNIDYWIRIIGPTHSRLLLQFQTIDLEHQEECLYDYVSVQESRSQPVDIDYDYYEPGTSAHQMAMLTAADTTANTDYLADDPNNSAEMYGSTAGKNWFLHKNMQRIQLNGQNAKIFKRELKRFPPLDHHRRLDDLRKKLSGDGRKKRNTVKTKLSTTTSSKHVDPTFAPYVRWCGSHTANMSRFDFISMQSSVLLHFHSDYSMSGMGFSIVWNAVDVSGCPSQTLASKEGTFTSPNYPNFLLNHLDCSWIIQAEMGKRIWLEFADHEVLDNAVLDIDLGNGHFMPYQMRRQLNDGLFVSRADRIVLKLRTGSVPKGRGFRAVYRTSNIRFWLLFSNKDFNNYCFPVNIINVEHSLALSNLSYGTLLHLNHPQLLPNNVNFTQHLVAPLGHVILMEIYGVGFSENRCHGSGSLEVCSGMHAQKINPNIIFDFFPWFSRFSIIMPIAKVPFGICVNCP